MFWRLFATFALLLVAALGLLGLVVGHRAEQLERVQQEANLRTTALLVQEAVRGVPAEQLQERIQTLAREEGRQTHISLLNWEGQILADSAGIPARISENPTRSPEVEQARQQGFGSHIRRDAPEGPLLEVALRCRDGGRTANAVAFVRLSLPLDRVQRQAGQLWPAVTTTAIVAAGLSLLLSAWFARRIARPIEEMTRAAERIAAGQVRERVHTTVGGEIARLAQTFNRMSARLAEQITQLEQEREQLRTVLSGMIEGVVALDAGQHILFANERAAQLLDFSAGARGVVGRRLWDVVRQRSLLDLVHRTLTGPGPQKAELNWHGPTERSLTVHAAPLPGSRGAVVVLHDTSELRKLERLRQEFVANVHHELKTPLSVIIACVETLLEGGAADDPEHCRAFLSKVADQASRLHRLILDLLSLARIESGAEIFSPETLDLRALIDDCLGRMSTRAAARRQTLRAIPAEQPVLAWADEEALSDVLDNLVDNALKYTPEGGTIEVRCWQEPDAACLEVRDTGIGIPEQDLPRIFERFYRVDKARSRELGGTGLGLSIVKHLVQALGGSVWASSKVGVGSTFSVRLPRGNT